MAWGSASEASMTTIRMGTTPARPGRTPVAIRARLARDPDGGGRGARTGPPAGSLRDVHGLGVDGDDVVGADGAVAKGAGARERDEHDVRATRRRRPAETEEARQRGRRQTS